MVAHGKWSLKRVDVKRELTVFTKEILNCGHTCTMYSSMIDLSVKKYMYSVQNIYKNNSVYLALLQFCSKDTSKFKAWAIQCANYSNYL